MATATRNPGFTLRLVLIIAVTVVLLIAVTVLSFRSVAHLVGTLQEEAAPKESLLSMKEVLIGMETASGQVRAYTLTQDPVFLEQYARQAEETRERLAGLDDEMSQIPGVSHAVDSLQEMVEAKFMVMDSMRTVADPQQLQAVIFTLNTQLKKAQKEAQRNAGAASRSGSSSRSGTSTKSGRTQPARGGTTEPTVQPQPAPQEGSTATAASNEKKKKGLGLFNRKKEKDASTAGADTPAGTGKESGNAARSSGASSGKDRARAAANPTGDAAKADIAEGRAALSQFEKKFKELSEDITLASEESSLMELGLVLRDLQLTAGIREKVREIENIHNLFSLTRADDASVAALATTWIITGFSAFAGLMLVMLVFTTVRHLRRQARLQAALQEQRDKAERLARAKEEFLAEMSHEIRTPLHAILGFTRLMRDTPLNTDQADYQKIISDSGTHLIDLVNGLLEHAKLEAGKVTLSHSAFRLPDLCVKTVRSLESTAREKGIFLRCEGEDKLPAVVQGDPGRIRQVLINLLGNALKFTEKGGVRLVCEAEPMEGGKHRITFRVIDTGPGIPAERLSKIFDPYEQAGEQARKAGGTGLGLTISKNIVELHGGAVKVESTLGKGSVFTASVITGPASEQDLPVEMDQAQAMRFQGQTVMVVDDEPFNLRLTETLLKSWNLRPILASDAAQALKILENDRADLVLMDLRMPGMNGMEASARIRSMRGGIFSRTPVVALSATIDTQEIDRALKSGMDAFLPKPFRETELRNMLLRYLQGNAAAPATPEPAPVQELRPSLESLKKLANGDTAFVREMLGIYQTSLQDALQDMKGAVQEEDWVKLGRVAHRLAAPTRHLGMHALLALLKKLEADADAGKTGDALTGQMPEIHREAAAAREWVATQLRSLDAA